MKTARLLLVLLALFGLTSLSDAQEVSKSGREKGLVIRPEIGVGMGSLGKSDNYYSYTFKEVLIINSIHILTLELAQDSVLTIGVMEE